MPGGQNKGAIVAISDKGGGIARAQVNSTIGAAIHTDRGRVVQHIYVTIVAVADDELRASNAAGPPNNGLTLLVRDRNVPQQPFFQLLFSVKGGWARGVLRRGAQAPLTGRRVFAVGAVL